LWAGRSRKDDPRFPVAGTFVVEIVKRLHAALILLLLGTPKSASGATFLVVNTNDSGAGSLRQAILEANAARGADLIGFSIPGPGVHTISPLSPLPALTDDAGATIDGYTQPGSSPNTLAVGDNAVLLIELRGMGPVVDAPSVNGFSIQSSSNIVRGIVVNRFDRGIWIQNGSGNEVTGCFIGTDPSGAMPLPNRSGVVLARQPEAIFRSLPEANSLIEGARIGGVEPATRNVISGNLSAGIAFGVFTSDSVAEGNLIGTNAAGIAAVPNGVGVAVNLAGRIQIGGAEPGAGNVISGNTDAGIIVAFSADTTIQGNRVGTTAAGNSALPNRFGIECESDLSTSVGGTEPGAGNVISGNSLDGVLIFFRASGDSVVQNLIGTDLTGQLPLGNGRNGVTIRSVSDGNVVGGADDARNVIAFNGAAGVAVGFDSADSSSADSVLRNSIHDNGGLGIDLGTNGVTPNDPADVDAGPNGLQNFPVLTGAVSSAGMLTVTGMLESTPSTTFGVEFFSNASCDPSGHGEGQVPLGSISVTTDSSGRAAFQATVPAPLDSAGFVTVTATDPAGNTSEFSACVVLVAAPSVPVPISQVALAFLALLLGASGLALSRRV
jgi:parallel beta-helix repeat protein